MKKVGFIIGTILSILGTNAAAQTKKEAIISFSQSDYNFGDIMEGQTATYTFTFTNNGKKPLLVTNVLTSCGCTIAEWSRDPIAPGKTGSIVANFNTKGKIGKQYKTITVLSNASNGPEKIAIQGTVLPKPIKIGLAEQLER